MYIYIHVIGVRGLRGASAGQLAQDPEGTRARASATTRRTARKGTDGVSMNGVAAN